MSGRGWSGQRARALVGALACLVLVAFSSAVRVRTAQDLSLITQLPILASVPAGIPSRYVHPRLAAPSSRRLALARSGA